MLERLQKLIEEGRVWVDHEQLHESSSLNESSLHAKWSEKYGLIICPEDIESIEIKLRPASEEL